MNYLIFTKKSENVAYIFLNFVWYFLFHFTLTNMLVDQVYVMAIYY